MVRGHCFIEHPGFARMILEALDHEVVDRFAWFVGGESVLVKVPQVVPTPANENVRGRISGQCVEVTGQDKGSSIRLNRS